MLLTKELDVTIGARNVNHYKALGYNIPMRHSDTFDCDVAAFGETIRVKIEDLPMSSHNKIRYKCDHCGKIVETEYCLWNKRKYQEMGDMCKSCARQIKLPKSLIDKYGYDNATFIPDAIKKKKDTSFERYGSEWHIASNAVKDKIKQTILDRYGVENSMQLDATKEKTRATMIERYGVEFITQSDLFKQRIRETCMKKYGVPNTGQVPEFRAKMRETLYANGTTPTSKAERAMCALLQDIYGADRCSPSYPVGDLSLDCLLVLDDVKIDVEYDGNYWHSGRGQKDAARNAVLMDMGYKILRVKANNRDTLPTKQQIIDAVDYLVKDNHHLVFIDMNK